MKPQEFPFPDRKGKTLRKKGERDGKRISVD
jgi:hypothetical protein